MHIEEERTADPAVPRTRRKPSLGFVLLAIAVVLAVIVSSFALAHFLVGEAFRRLTGG
ncbi:hypothetical protein [Paenibacillus glycinis]|uniref:Uncharacterized protein n=1 Tax=Paenibacillus glycinis TaxID=2697035 RepID=A0ABW9XXR1_9BACL|nr:hypothetical protein [Paenibacillus glycinis]NBD27518.1 hypothetical protein [Paenibacillus glycinis]